METFGKLIGTAVERLVGWIVIPVTSVIPRLVSSGALLVLFGAMWFAFGAAAATNPAALDDTWQAIGSWPLPVQAIGWLLFLPVMAGLWVWEADWVLLARVVVVAALAGWNLLIFVPRREQQPLATATEA
jgi:hypothetical protein